MRENGPVSISVKLAGSAVLSVGASGTIYTDPIQLSNFDNFALTYSISCTGTPNIKIEIEQAIVAPAATNAADSNYVTPEGITPVESTLVNKTTHHRAIALVPVEYFRLKITEQTGSVADSVLTISLSVQRKFEI
jgi:hypothetical protein